MLCLPGSALTIATKSFNVLAGELSGTASMLGLRAIMVTGARSLIGS